MTSQETPGSTALVLGLIGSGVGMIIALIFLLILTPLATENPLAFTLFILWGLCFLVGLIGSLFLKRQARLGTWLLLGAGFIALIMPLWQVITSLFLLGYESPGSLTSTFYFEFVLLVPPLLLLLAGGMSYLKRRKTRR